MSPTLDSTENSTERDKDSLRVFQVQRETHFVYHPFIYFFNGRPPFKYFLILNSRGVT